MAFSKAKITRFNEITSCAPPPGSYDPKIKDHVANVVIPSTGRFSEPQSPGSDNGSVRSSPVFRTPTLRPKRKQMPSSLPKMALPPGKISEELQEKIVECMNKTECIKELEHQVEELKEQIRHLEDEIKNEKNTLSIKSKEQIEAEIEDLKLENAKLKNQYETNSELYKDTLHKMEDSVVKLTEELDVLKSTSALEKKQLLEKIEDLQNDYDLLNIEFENAKFNFYEQTLALEETVDKLSCEKDDMTIYSLALETDIEEKQKEFESKMATKQKLIMDLQNELSSVQCELVESRSDFERKISLHETDMENLQKLHANEIDDLTRQMEDLSELISERDNRLASTDAQRCLLEGELQETIKKIKDLETEFANTKETLQTLHNEELEKLKKSHLSEIEDLQFEMLKVVTDLKKTICENEKKSAQKIREVQELCNAKLKQAEENANEKVKLAEIQMEEKCRQIEFDVKKKLEEQEAQSEAILKECQAIGEYNIIQCELEKQAVQSKLTDTERALQDTADEKQKLIARCEEKVKIITDLQNRLSLVVKELNETEEKCRIKENNLLAELEQTKKDKRRYSITLDETRSTLEVLRKRLVESDKDVEQLKAEINSLEVSKLASENRCSELEISLERCEAEKSEEIAAVCQMVLQTEEKLKSEIEKYKSTTVIQVALLEERKQKLENNVKELMALLETQQKQNIEVQTLMGQSQLEIEKHELANAELISINQRLESELASKNKDVEQFKHENKILAEKVKALEKELAEKNELKAASEHFKKMFEDLEIKMQNVESVNAELNKMVEMQASLIGPFREQLEAYDEERRSLLDRKHEAENEAREMGLKYAELLGHQNNKQKIKHLIALKNKNFDLIKDKQELEAKLHAQQKIIERLKQDQRENKSLRKTRLYSSDKENHSPSRSVLALTMSENPTSSSTPLKERNGHLEMAEKRKQYSDENLNNALNAIDTGVSIKGASKLFGVPRSTLQFRLKNRNNFNATPGPVPILTTEEENTLVRWIFECHRKEFARRKGDIQLSVQNYLQINKRQNPFKNNLPGRGRYKAFLRRDPEISQRTSEAVTNASSCVSERDSKTWFDDITDYLNENNFTDVLKDSSRIFNGDETGFQLCPKNDKVLAPRGSKNVYEVQMGPDKQTITVMNTFSANGNMCPPMVIYPYQRLPKDIINSVPNEWCIGHSESGWIKAEVFFKYFANSFHPYLKRKNIEFPVLLFVDGHKTHLTYELSKLCTDLQIILIALYPNVTRILQPKYSKYKQKNVLYL